MNKPTKKQMSVVDLKVNPTVNVRLPENYDIPEMKEQIRLYGRILQPITIRGEDNTVLRGNRRTWAAQEMVADGKTPAELVEALKKVEVIVYTGLTAQEEMQVIIDQGEKAISRAEIALVIWRMHKNFFSEGDIIKTMYFPLARFTGNEKKLGTMSVDPKLKEKELKGWFHGTVGNYIMAASRMGDYIRDQFILTLRAEDGLLKDGEKVEIRCTRKRINKLSEAKTYDASTEGKGWDLSSGGMRFNETLAKFKAEDSTGIKEKVSRPTVKELTDLANAFKEPAIRMALRSGAGLKTEGGVTLVDLDEQLYRMREITTVLKTYAPQLNGTIRPLVESILHETPAQLTRHLEELVKVHHVETAKAK